MLWKKVSQCIPGPSKMHCWIYNTANVYQHICVPYWIKTSKSQTFLREHLRGRIGFSSVIQPTMIGLSAAANHAASHATSQICDQDLGLPTSVPTLPALPLTTSSLLIHQINGSFLLVLLS